MEHAREKSRVGPLSYPILRSHSKRPINKLRHVQWEESLERTRTFQDLKGEQSWRAARKCGAFISPEKSPQDEQHALDTDDGSVSVEETTEIAPSTEVAGLGRTVEGHSCGKNATLYTSKTIWLRDPA